MSCTKEKIIQYISSCKDPNIIGELSGIITSKLSEMLSDTTKGLNIKTNIQPFSEEDEAELVRELEQIELENELGLVGGGGYKRVKKCKKTHKRKKTRRHKRSRKYKKSTKR